MKRTDITALFPDATDEQIKQIMDLNGADINRAKGDLETVKADNAALSAALEVAKAAGVPEDELKAIREKADSLQAELDGMKQAEALRLMREKVSAETKVPANLLTGDTEEACAKQAAAILAFTKSNGYPAVRDAGEPQSKPVTKADILAIPNERERLRMIREHIDLFTKGD